MAGKSKYDGNILLNSRTIINCAETLQAFKPSISSHRKIDEKQLVEFLTLIESLIIGRTIYYDGTAGGDVLSALSQAEEYIESHTDHDDANNLFTIAKPGSNEETLSFCRTAASTGEALMRQGIEERAFAQKKGFDLPKFESEIKLFQAEWRTLPKSPDLLREKAAEIVQKGKYRGSKCVAGILLASADHIENDKSSIPIAFVCADVINDFRTTEEASRLLDYLMNDTFRPNLLPSLASDLCKASYFAHENVAQNSKDFHFSYTSYVAKSMVRDSKRLELCVGNLAAELGVKDEPIPWLGLLCLLNAEGSSPFAIFEHALEDRRLLSNLFQRVDVKNSMNGSFIEDNLLADETAIEFVHRNYANLYGFGQQAAEGNSHFLEVGVQFSPQDLDSLTQLCGRFLGSVFSPEFVDLAVPDAISVPLQMILAGMPAEAGLIGQYFKIDSVQESVRSIRNSWRTDTEKDLISVHSKMRQTFNSALKHQTGLIPAIDKKILQMFHTEVDWATIRT